MKNKSLFVLLLVLCTSLQAYTQREPELAIALLANDNIAEVNIDQDAFIEAIGTVSDLSKAEFAGIKAKQKIAILLVYHTAGKPSVELHANPKLDEATESAFLTKLNALDPPHTKILDFPILLLLNAKFEDVSKDFSKLIFPSDRAAQAYEQASLNEKYELNKHYAVEVLQVLSAYETIVDDQFAGVKNLGNLVQTTNFQKPQDITGMTSTNSDYWRAIMEMSIGNQLIPATKIFMLVSQGECDYAQKYLEMILYFSESKSVPDHYLTELADRLDVFYTQLNTQIQAGIAFHDQGKYSEAIALYEDLLKDYPNSAWASYELYFSQNALDLKNKKYEMNDRTEWKKAKTGIYAKNPLYNLDVSATNGKEGYLLFRRQAISKLFQNRESMLSDVYTYADIAFDLEVYDFAAQLFWLSFTFDKQNESSLDMFLYSLEKLGVTKLKENFKGDFETEFKKIEKDREKEMTESVYYKMFGN